MKTLKNVSIVVLLIYMLMVHGATIQDWMNCRFCEIEKAVEHGITVRIEASWNPTTMKIESESQNDEQ